MAALGKAAVAGIASALGAVLGGLAGEGLFSTRYVPPGPTPRSVCLLLDVSGSMSRVIAQPGGGPVQTQLEALKRAADEFVQRQDLALDEVGVAVFSTDASALCDLTHDRARLGRAVRVAQAGGTTNMARGLDVAAWMLQRSAGEKWVLLFSDGKPEGASVYVDPVSAAVESSQRLRASGANIVAIGTGLADAAFLARITGRSDHVFTADPLALADAFRRSEEVIHNRQMLASLPDGGAFMTSLLRAAAWASLIAIGSSMALVAAQNHHMRRRAIRLRQLPGVLAGGILTGLLAGAAGQSLYYAISSMPEAFVRGGRIVAWLLLGSGTGLGMSAFVPNLGRRRAVVGGLVGGAIAGLCFLGVGPGVGDTAARLVGAAALGLATGMMLVLVERVRRRAWLVVHWSRNETSTLLLGRKPIVIGGGSRADVCTAFDDTVAVRARISFVEDEIRLEDPSSRESRVLADREIVDFGRISVEVRAAVASEAEAQGAPTPRRAATPRSRRPDAAATRREPAGAAGHGGGAWYSQGDS
jgi:Ca-activated chloride channel family protein